MICFCYSKMHSCNVCSTVFRQKAHLKRHYQSLHLGIKFECKLCGKKLSEKSHLKTHIQNVHRTLDVQFPKIECDICHKHYANKPTLAKHKKAIHLNQKWLCIACDYKGNTQRDVQDHKASIHDKKFHLSCNMCEFTSSWHASLRTHKNSRHLGVKFQCKVCDYETTQKGHLARHIDSVHERTKYHCSICSKVYSDKRGLKKHRKLEHSLI